MTETLTRETLRTELVDIFTRELFVTDRAIDDNDELITDLGLDSANFAVGLVAIEERFDIQVAQQTLVECVTFADVLDLIITTAR